MARKPRQPRSSLTAEDVRRILDYDPISGELTWKVLDRSHFDSEMGWRAKCRYFGKRAGAVLLNGYRSVSIRAKRYYAHRLAWLMMTGEWPGADIDHINGRRDDNRWENLRSATRSQNHENRVGHRFTGVSFHKKSGRWRATITTRGIQKELGTFSTREEAAQVYREAKAAAHRFQPFVREVDHASA